MKKLTIVSLFIFWAVIVAILAAGFLARNNPNNSISKTGLPGGGQATSTLTAQEVAKHNQPSDCWLIINNKVYDVTSYLGQHPGGSGTITPYCGKDATQAFDTKDLSNPRPHSNYADQLLANYYIGAIGSLQSSLQGTNAGFSSANNQTGSGSTGSAQNNPSSGTSISLTSQEVANHNSTGDCWMIISGKVYNVTSYINSHPGGVAAIAAYCGKDATQAFNIQVPHSQNAHNILASYYVGDLNQTVQQQSVQNTTNVTPPPTTRGNEFDDD